VLATAESSAEGTMSLPVDGPSLSSLHEAKPNESVMVATSIMTFLNVFFILFFVFIVLL
jgi:hypothetical protein